jgi:two-component system chemotaxis response regulator CheY
MEWVIDFFPDHKGGRRALGMENRNDPQAASARNGASIGTVLIVDDTETSATAIEMACLGIPGVNVALVSSALEAVRVLQDQDQTICAVVTDIRMPAMDGFELIQFIRTHRRHAGTPIIVVTADTAQDTPERTSRLGVNAYFSKPFSPKAVRRALERLLNASRSPE